MTAAVVSEAPGMRRTVLLAAVVSLSAHAADRKLCMDGVTHLYEVAFGADKLTGREIQERMAKEIDTCAARFSEAKARCYLAVKNTSDIAACANTK